MKKALLFTIIILLCFVSLSYGQAYCTGSSPTWVSTPDLTSLQACVSGATAGDTIYVESGAATWTSSLRVTKAVSIIAPGGTNGDTTCDAGETCITGNWAATSDRETVSNYLVYINFVSTGFSASYDKDMRLSGFNFNLNSKVNGLLVIHNSMTYPMNKLQVDHNTFFNPKCPTSDSAEGVNPQYYIVAEAYGVFHNNYFLGYPTELTIGRNESWGVTGKYPGSSKALFFEDNVYSMTTNCLGTNETRAPSMSLGTGGSVVFRYNNVTRNIVGGGTPVAEWFQNHGNNAYNNTGGMVLEVYGNKYIDTQGIAGFWGNFRGGRNVVFFNQLITSYTGGTSWLTGPYFDFKDCEECEGTGPVNNGRGADIVSPTGYNCPTGDNRLWPTGEVGISGTCIGDSEWTGAHPWWPLGNNTVADSVANCKTCSIDGQPQHVWKNYVWNNRVGSGGASNKLVRIWKSNGESPEKPLIENTHYFVQREGATFDGSLTPVSNIYTPLLGKPGVGCGLIGSRPATCSTGAGYWVIPDSTQSCSQVLSTSMGKNPSNKILGYLSTCKSTNNWSENTQPDITAKYTYVPADYPHILRTGPTNEMNPPVLSGIPSPTGQQECPDEPTLIPVSFTVTDDSTTVTCVSCKEGVEGCDSASTYDEITAMTAKTTYTSTKSGTTFAQTASISSACDSTFKHWARCTDYYGNDMTSSVGIAYSTTNDEDSDDPTLTAAEVIATGTKILLTFSEPVQIGTGGSGGWTLSRTRSATPANVTMTYLSGAGTNVLEYTLGSVILSTDTVLTVVYTQPTDGITDFGGIPIYCSDCPDPGKNADKVCEVPNGDAGGRCNWTIQRAQRYPQGDPLTGNVVSFANACDETESLGCTDIDETNCIRVTKTDYTKEEDVYAFKKLSDTDMENIYLQFYFKNMSQPKDATGCHWETSDHTDTGNWNCTGITNMTDGHDIEMIGFTPGQKTTYAALPGDYPANVYMGLHQRGGNLTISAFHYVTHNHEIPGTTSIGNAGTEWIGVRLHIYNSATTGDYYEWWADWDNDGTWTPIGRSDGVGGFPGYWDHSTSAYSTAAISFDHPFRYIYVGQNDVDGNFDVQLTGIKVNTTGFPPSCTKSVTAVNELASIVTPEPVTNSSSVGSTTTQTLYDQATAVPAITTETLSDVNVGVRFQSSQTGTVTKICFYKSATMTGTHIGTLYSANGAVLGQTTFSGETASGWQCQALSPTISILKDTTYTAAVYIPTNWVRTSAYFGNAHANGGYLTAQAENDWYYISTPGVPHYPDQRSGGYSNYWVDLEIEYSGASGPWQVSLDNTSAAGAKCTISGLPVMVDDTGTVETTVSVAPGWKAAISGCGGSSVLADNVYTYTTAAVTAACTVTVTCGEKSIPLWVAP